MFWFSDSETTHFEPKKRFFFIRKVKKSFSVIPRISRKRIRKVPYLGKRDKLFDKQLLKNFSANVFWRKYREKCFVF